MTSLNQKLMKNSLFLTSNLFCGQKWNKSVVIKKWGKVGAYPRYGQYQMETPSWSPSNGHQRSEFSGHGSLKCMSEVS